MARTKLWIALTVALWTAPVWVAQATGCYAASDGRAPFEVVDAGPLGDAGADSGATVTTCCRLDNELGERLNYICGESISVEWAVARGYRCWEVN